MAMEEVVIAGIILLFKHPPSVTAAAEEEEETLSLSLFSTHFKLKFFPNAAPRDDSFFRSFSVAATVCMTQFLGRVILK